MNDFAQIIKRYQLAQEQYAGLGVETELAIERLKTISISIQCWQGDDVGGFEKTGGQLSDGGIQVTDNYPGKARSINELRKGAEKTFSPIPGNHRFNLHAMYGDFDGKIIDRDKITIDHFKSWIEWAKANNIKLDFNATCFSHPKADSGFTLSSKDEATRDFWIEHVRRCREICAFLGGKQNNACIHNLWIPDGMRDTPVDRLTHRKLLKDSLDKIFEIKYDPLKMKDSLESKLFGIGSESFVVGSHEFYLGYAINNKKMSCYDLGHFHPTESIADKISATLLFIDELLLHVSRGVHWDSDHVVILNDELKAVAEEIVRADLLDRVHGALDFFDATLNRIGAWALGTRATLKAFLIALLEPYHKLKAAEETENYFERLAILEHVKLLPVGAVWDNYCVTQNVTLDYDLIKNIVSIQ